MGHTFSDLIKEVHETGKCGHCGGCVSFCSAINYGALKLNDEGKPVYDDREKCLECGLCYSICPQTSELDKEIKENAGWRTPIGNVIGVKVARAKDSAIRENATDGGVVTALLTYLFDSGRIDGAIVSHNTDQGRVPWLAKTREEILSSAGSHFSSSHGMVHFSKEYATFSPSIEALSGIGAANPDRLAFVGTPCQINTIRKMQALRILPSDSIKYCLGLFCSANFLFTDDIFKTLENKYKFSRADIKKINVKDDFILTPISGESIHVSFEELEAAKRYACNFCNDFSAEYADISFGGIGADKGWTTVVTRSAVGSDLYDDAVEKVLDAYRIEDNSQYATQAEEKILRFSEMKKKKADQFHSNN